MDLNLLHLIPRCLNALCHAVKQRLRRWTKLDSQSLALNAVLDLSRSKSELVLEDALLRQQLIVLQRQVKRSALTWRDRALFVLMARKLATWKKAVMIVQPETLLRWHRDLFRRVWRHKSRRKGKKGREPLAEILWTSSRTWHGAAFDRVAEGTNIDVLTTPYEAPKANAVCQRFLGGMRRECLDLLPNPVRPHPQRELLPCVPRPAALQPG